VRDANHYSSTFFSKCTAIEDMYYMQCFCFRVDTRRLVNLPLLRSWMLQRSVPLFSLTGVIICSIPYALQQCYPEAFTASGKSAVTYSLCYSYFKNLCFVNINFTRNFSEIVIIFRLICIEVYGLLYAHSAAKNSS
jgi:hypothetical protein